MTIFSIPVTKDTFVISDKKYHAPQCQLPFLPVGKTGLGYMFFTNYLSYIFFDLSSIPPHERVFSATLKLFFNNPPFEGQPPEFICLQALAEPFWDCFTKYTNRPATIPKVQKKIPIFNIDTSISVDVTKLVIAWHSGRLDNNGLALLPLNFTTGGVLIFCSSNSPESSRHPLLIVDTKPSKKKRTVDKEETHVVKEAEGFSSAQEVWNYSDHSFIAQNIGHRKILVKLQCGPDSENFIDEEPEIELLPGQTHVFINNFFTRYARLKFCLYPGDCEEGYIKIWLQGRF